MRKEFVFQTKKNNTINISCYGIDHLETSPCVVFVHGFKGFKDWGFWPETGYEFANKGFFVLSFNFSHNGIGDDFTSFTEMEKFAENTFSLEISELNEIIDAYKTDFFGVTINSKIAVLGHSRGGAIAILTAAARNDINAVSVWASIAKLDRYSKRQKENWRKKGSFDVLNSRTKQVMRLSTLLLDDIEENSNGSLNLERAVKELKIPLLIVHGDQDLAVPVSEAEQLYDWADKNLTTLYKIKSAGHTFNIVHPFEGRNHNFDDLLNETTTFFKSNLFEDLYAG